MNLSKKISGFYQKWKAARSLRLYCLDLCGKQSGSKLFNYFIILLLLVVLSFWFAPTPGRVLVNLSLLMLFWAVGIYYFEKHERRGIIEACRGKITELEINKRINQLEHQQMLGIINEIIQTRYQVQQLREHDGVLFGHYGRDKLAVVYRHLENDEVLSTREMMQIMHQCRQAGLKQVRVFTNGEFSSKAKLPGEHYDLEVKLYNGARLKRFLKGSSLYPTVAELDQIIKRESEKRQRKITILKKELLRKTKYRNYLKYGLILLLMARFELGSFYLNIVFAFLLLSLGVLSIFMSKEAQEEEIIF